MLLNFAPSEGGNFDL